MSTADGNPAAAGRILDAVAQAGGTGAEARYPAAGLHYAAENLATLRWLALNLLKREKTIKRGIKGKQLNASWNHAHLLLLLQN